VQTIIDWLNTGINSDFGLALRLDLLLRLVVAVVLGGAIGWEREASSKPAGLRTNILICAGAALFTDLSIRFGGIAIEGAVRDPARIAAQIVTGIGFLGAGTIIQARGTVTGLTTAATLWVVAGIGMSVGSGSYVEAVGATALVLVVLVLLAPMENAIARRRPAHLRIVLEPAAGAGEIVEEKILEVGLQIIRRRIEKDAKLRSVILHLWVRGSPKDIRVVQERMVVREDVAGFYTD
jgi:putative Mg2+ transporter-C (MgtC) family protein